MVRNKKGMACLAAATSVFAARSALATLNSPVYQNSSNQTTFDANANIAAASGNLILNGNPAIGSISAPTSDGGFSATGLYDGVSGNANNLNLAYFDNTSSHLGGATPPTYIFNLNTSSANGSAAGYNVSSIQSVAGWSDSSIGDQDFDVFVETTASPTTFIQIGGDFKNAPFAGGAGGSTMTTLTDSTGILASGVTAVEFKLLSAIGTQAGNGGTVFREMTVVGTAVQQTTFDADTTNAGAQDGSGVWDSTTANFYNPSSATDGAFANTTSSLAVFGNGSSAGTAGVVTVGTVTTNAIQFTTTTGNYVLTGGTINLAGTDPAVIANVDATIGSTIDASTGVNGFYKTGVGNLSLTGPVTLGTNNLIVGAGTLTFSGAGSANSSSGILLVGNAGGTTGTLNISTTGTLSFSATSVSALTTIGSGSGAVGVVNHNSGTLTLSSAIQIGYNLTIVSLPTSGTYNLTGTGILNLLGNTGGSPGLVVGWGGNGSFYQAGTSSLNDASNLYIGGNNGTAVGSGVATFAGGTANISTGGVFSTNIGFSSGATGVLNIGTQAGGNAVVTIVNGGINIGTTSGATGILNLDSGTLAINAYFIEKIAGSTSLLNLNGGTLKVGSAVVPALINTTNSPVVNVYNGGLTVDTNGFNSSIGVPLQATAGNGVYPTAGFIAASSVISGLTGMPLVTVTDSGAGTGITANATVAGGTLTGFTLTSPGQNYAVGDTLTFSMNSATGLSTFTHTLTSGDVAANTTGGLTKAGNGILTLSAANTYSGPTKVTGGTLQLARGVGIPVTVPNYSFETPTEGGFGYNPSGGSWTFNQSTAGITRGNTGFLFNGAAPDGSQAAFLQNQGFIYQNLIFPDNANYTLSFYTEQRTAGGVTQAQQFAVSIDTYGSPTFALLSGSGLTPGATWAQTTYVFSETAGSHMLLFSGLVPSSSGDNSAYVDDVVLSENAAQPSSYIPSASPVVISDNATLDINGNQQSIGSLTGTSLSSVTLEFGNLVTGNDNTSTIFAGVISGTGNVIKVGTGVQMLSGSNNYTGGTIVSGGRLAFNASGAFPLFTSLNVASGAVAVASTYTGSTKNTLFVTGLSLAGSTGAWTGKVNLTNNDMVLRNGSIGTVTNQVAQGYAAGTWQGSGGIVSSTAAANPSHLTALGVIQNSADGTPTGTAIYSSFDGQTVSNADVLVKYTYYGDSNLDGLVDGSDYSRIDNAVAANLGTPGSMTGWFNGDFNYDGIIDGSDYTLIDNAYNTQGAQINSLIAVPTAQIAGSSAVPEPAMLSLLGLGITGLLRRRRRC